ncbi:MAG: type I polyketide synthase, partial [Gemmataceae bacterium]
SICVAGNDGLGPVWRLAGHLAAERIPFSMEGLYPDWASQSSSQERWIEVPIGMEEFPKTVPVAPVSKIIEPAMPSVVSEPSVAKPHQVSQLPGYHPPPLLDTFAEQFQAQGQVVLADTEAHAAFLRYDQSLRRTVHDTIAFQGQLFDLLLSDPHPNASLAVEPLPSTEPVPTATAHSVALDRNQCLEYAIGSIGKVLGPAYSAIDSFPTRVRLPDEPLMLVDRIVVIEGEPLSLSHGRVVTEHDVLSGAWYLDNGRIPTCLAVESGQADLFLSGYLGIDLHTHGLAVYRLLDAVVTFHRGLPTAGQTIRYDIHIDHFFRQGNTHLFRFRFEATVDGEILLTMTDGCAGFFGAEELAAGKGIIQTELQRRHIPGKEADDRAILPEMRNESFDESQVDCLRRGDLAGCFGPAFIRLPLTSAVRLPGGKMRLVHRIERLEPRGGRFGLGLIRGEADIHPDDWFLTCHFVDDQVMPGTLMYECCLHTLRIFLMRLGWVGEQEEVAHEPVPGVASRLKCRGQVTASTRMVTYEVVLKQRDYAPDAFVIADALMYADGKPIVEITDMSLRFTGLTRERVHSIWQSQPSQPLFDRHHILAFATGKPSEAFGDRYLPFDNGKFLARLPAPPYSFLDRIVSLRGEPWQMVTGGSVDGEYDVPQGEWYFQSERSSVMPFAVLLEIPLQVCGWMSSYMGSALTNPGPLHYRNLGGDAELLRVVRDPVPETGTMLTSRIATTRVAASGGMIIQDFTFEVFDAEGTFYRGGTTFGFFSPQALAQQIGIREGAPYQMSEAEQSRARAFPFPADPPFPDRSLAMIDFVDAYLEDGGPAALGLVRGFKMVNPEEWFFKAHFYQDPVMPGSLGLEAMLQLLKVAATLRWPGEVVQDFEANLGRHRWMYRGQVVPSNKRVVVQAEITHVDPVRRELTADGWLSVDGLVIYRMSDFRVRMVARPS